jgi:hypothetical protein
MVMLSITRPFQSYLQMTKQIKCEIFLLLLIFRRFEKISKHCLEYSDLIPLSFVLGFYVNLVVKRWWEMFQSM